MSNVVEQIMHPHLQQEIEKMEAAHQVELGELREKMQSEIDELEERVGNAASSYDEQYGVLNDLLKEDKEGKPIPIRFDQLVKAASLKMSSYHNDWDVLYPLRQVLERIETVERVVERTRTVYEVPPSLRALVRNFIEALNNYV